MPSDSKYAESLAEFEKIINEERPPEEAIQRCITFFNSEEDFLGAVIQGQVVQRAQIVSYKYIQAAIIFFSADSKKLNALLTNWEFAAVYCQATVIVDDKKNLLGALQIFQRSGFFATLLQHKQNLPNLEPLVKQLLTYTALHAPECCAVILSEKYFEEFLSQHPSFYKTLVEMVFKAERLEILQQLLSLEGNSGNMSWEKSTFSILAEAISSKSQARRSCLNYSTSPKGIFSKRFMTCCELLIHALGVSSSTAVKLFQAVPDAEKATMLAKIRTQEVNEIAALRVGLFSNKGMSMDVVDIIGKMLYGEQGYTDKKENGLVSPYEHCTIQRGQIAAAAQKLQEYLTSHPDSDSNPIILSLKHTLADHETRPLYVQAFSPDDEFDDADTQKQVAGTHQELQHILKNAIASIQWHNRYMDEDKETDEMQLYREMSTTLNGTETALPSPSTLSLRG